MGGYGAAVVGGFVRAGAAIFATATGFWPGGNSQEGATENTEDLKDSKDNNTKVAQ